MNNMAFEPRRVGGTSVLVSALGFGGAPIGGFRFPLSDQQGADALGAAFAGGIRYFDTSPYYGYGRSELIFGYALRPHPRDDYVLSSKVGRCMTPLAPGEVVEGWRAGGLSFKATLDYSSGGNLS